jgi:pimeloyl-ACP methyl ester carboxylesterase
MSAAPSPDPAKKPARWREMASRRSMVEVGSYRIYTVEFGKVGAEPLILLHGLSGSSRWWKRNVLAFAEEFRVVVPDLIGFGRTRIRGPFPGFSRIAEVLAEWMDTLGLCPADVVGHSMGGQISVHLAARFPERVNRLVLVDATGIPRPLTPRAVLRFATEVAPPTRWGDPAFVPVIVGDALYAGVRTIVRALAHLLRDDVRPLLSRITAPTLVVWGERDSLVPLAHAEELRRAIPGAKLVILRRAAHNPMVDRPEEFNRVVRDFLEGESAGE